MKKKKTGITLFLLMTGAVLFAQTPADDFEILRDFYETCGVNSTLNWDLSDTSMRTWGGIILNAEGRVKGIVLYGNGLSGTLPEDFGLLDGLTRLTLYNNDLAGPIPPEWGNLSNLKDLFLGNISGTNTIPPELAGLADLETLSLRDCGLTGTIPPGLGSLENLEVLNLSSNNLSGSVPPELGDLSELRSLIAYGNNLSGEIPEELGNLSNLTLMMLDGNALSGRIPSSLGELAALKDLYLGANQLTGAVPSSLADLSSLETLILSQNNLTDLPEEIMQLTALNTLTVHRNKLCHLSSTLEAWLDISTAYPWTAGQDCPSIDTRHVLVLDRSGSMGYDVEPGSNTQRMDILKPAALAMQDDATQGMTVEAGMASFSTTAREDYGLSLLDGAGAVTDAIKALIQALQPENNTAIGDALLTAYNMISEQPRMEDDCECITLFTDGENNMGSDPEDHESLIQNRGIHVYAVGTGEDEGLAYLNTITNAHNGRTFFGNSVSELASSFGYIRNRCNGGNIFDTDDMVLSENQELTKTVIVDDFSQRVNFTVYWSGGAAPLFRAQTPGGVIISQSSTSHVTYSAGDNCPCGSSLMSRFPVFPMLRLLSILIT